jgi:membrane protease YdiL (CAAX protease family)
VLLPGLALAGVVAGTRLAALAREAAHGMSREDALRAVQLDPIALSAIQAAAFGVALVVGLVLFQRRTPTRVALGLAPLPGAVVVLGVVAGLALQFPLAELANLAHEIVPPSIEEQLLRRRLVTPDDLGSALSIIAAVVVVAPATEELLFRGLLLPALADRYGEGVALGLTSIAFGLVHVDPAAMVYAGVAGVVLGIVALRTGSTLAAIAVHAAVNAVPLLLPERVIRIDGFNTVSVDVYHLPAPLLLGAGAVAAAALAVMARITDIRR